MACSFVYLHPGSDAEAAGRQRTRLLDFAERLGFGPATVVEETALPSQPWLERRLGSLLNDVAQPGDHLIVAEACDLANSLAELYAALAVAADRIVGVTIVEGLLVLTPAEDHAGQASTLRLAASLLAEFQRGRTRAGLRRAAAEGRSGGRRKGSTGRLKLDTHLPEIAVSYQLGTSPAALAARFDVTPKTMRRFLARRFPKAE